MRQCDTQTCLRKLFDSIVLFTRDAVLHKLNIAKVIALNKLFLRAILSKHVVPKMVNSVYKSYSIKRLNIIIELLNLLLKLKSQPLHCYL